jgi:hypothetical protein
LELAPLVIDGDVADLGRQPLALGWAQAEVVEDLLDRCATVEIRDDLQLAATPAADERVGVVDVGDKPCPTPWVKRLLRGWLSLGR